MLKRIFFRKKAVSLAEILISMVILSIVAAGIFASFIAANRITNRSKQRMAAVNLARYISEDLYKYVSADTWTTNLLSCAAYPCTKSTPGDFSLPALDANNPLSNYTSSLVAYLDINLDNPNEPNPAPADCNVTCARIITVRVVWDE